MSVLFADVNPKNIIGYPNRDKRQGEPVYLGTVHVETNHDNAVLDNVTWFPYEPSHKLNDCGRNGYIEGTVRSGSTTSRLFQYAHTRKWEVGSIHRFDYAHLDHIMQHYVTDEQHKRVPTDELSYTRHTCG